MYVYVSTSIYVRTYVRTYVISNALVLFQCWHQYVLLTPHAPVTKIGCDAVHSVAKYVNA